VRLGYEFFATESCVARAGYVYNVNQIPDGTLTPYLPATLEHAFSTGLGFMWGTTAWTLPINTRSDPIGAWKPATSLAGF